MEDLYLDNYIKEIFLDSGTTLAVISGIGRASEGDEDGVPEPEVRPRAAP